MLQCKECKEEKWISEYYKHPEGKHWVLSRCKLCIKKWRSSLREREMSRVRDKNRYHNNVSWRKDYIYDRSKKFRKNNPEKCKAHSIVWTEIKRNDFRLHKCSNCWKVWDTDLHHYDYSLPRSVYEVCRICHANIHLGNIDIIKTKIINF